MRTSAVRSAEVKDGALRARDFAPGQLPAGATGAKGDAGATGPQGAPIPSPPQHQ